MGSFGKLASFGIGFLMLFGPAAGAERAATKRAAPKEGRRPVAFLDRVVSWNAYSRQFIDAPTFKVIPLPNVVRYRARVSQEGAAALEVSSDKPVLSLKPIWGKMKTEFFDLTLDWLDKDGKAVATETLKARTKAPDWQGKKKGPDQDWAAAADRNIAFLIDAGEHARAAYREPGYPVWFWNPVYPLPNEKPLGGAAYPSLHMPLFIRAFAANVTAERPQAPEARRILGLIGEWLLKNRRPDSGALPLFPYSSICMGKFGGAGLEVDSVNLLRASHLGEGLVTLYEMNGDERLLDYAVHIADTTRKFQAPDGSFPYRVNPQTGAVTEAYTCHASEFVALVDAISRHRFDLERAKAARRAVDWMLAYPLQTCHWQSGFEDVGHFLPYKNLENWSPSFLIRHLCEHKDDDPAYVPAAEKLNRWIEDQFVVFGRDDAVDVVCPTPLVTEQFQCFYPMEVHTGNWILALLALHKATGKAEYLDKAKEAANAIAKSQFPDGELSTWGVNEDGKPRKAALANWYGCNAFGTAGLYAVDAYVKGLKSEPRKHK